MDEFGLSDLLTADPIGALESHARQVGAQTAGTYLLLGLLLWLALK